MNEIKRKVNLVGANTLTVSLPNEFTSLAKIKKGDELSILYSNNQIKYFKDNSINKKIEIEIDKNHSYHCITRILSILYRTGYDSIKINFKNSYIIDPKNKNKIEIDETIFQIISRHFIGIEIMSNTKNQISLKCFLESKKENLELLETRIFNLFSETINELISSINEKNEKFFETYYQRHDNITRLLNYMIRLSQTFEKNENKKLLNYSYYIDLDFLLDKYRHICDLLKNNNYGKETLKLVKIILNYFIELYHSSLNFLIKPELLSKRYEILKKINSKKNSSEENFLLLECKSFLDKNTRFIEYSYSKFIL